MKNMNYNSEIKVPFYVKTEWFNKLYDYVFNNYARIDLEDSNRILPHIEIKQKIKFIYLNSLRSLTNYYSPEFLPENTPYGCTDLTLAKFYSNDKKIRHYDLIELNPLSGENADSIATALKNQGFSVDIFQTTVNWSHPNINSLDQFWALRPNKMKNILKSKKTKALRDNNYEVKIIYDQTELCSYLNDYHDVYNKSWKNNEPYTDFIDDIVTNEHKNGNLRLGILYANTIAAAAQIWFVHDKTAFIFKLSYNNKYRSESFGSILMEAMFNHVITVDSVTKVDFLTGDDKYKADWMTTSRPMFGIKAYNKGTINGLMTLSMVKANKFIKKLLPAQK